MPPPPPIRFRILRIADYDAIHALWRRTEGIGLSDSDGRGAVGRFLRRNPNLSLVATSRGRIIGGVLCGHDGRRGYLHHLVVARNWRRRGIGRALVDSCLGRLREEGISKCNLFLFAGNRSGRAFWLRLGWTVRDNLRLVQRETGTAACVTKRVSC